MKTKEDFVIVMKNMIAPYYKLKGLFKEKILVFLFVGTRRAITLTPSWQIKY